ncbi:alpha-N-arabinofuranosidase [uncultured Sphaerochaeta sp.]|uniref:arabinosylfuranosidase ArfA n=1 Tax=uncultured Sphaerochaeta sp. TaxID=886478 RepID=UPI002A0A5BD0|nr:alpha-N-arabinofuranosidase [uncultured Sphaerochaeta sp.]
MECSIIANKNFSKGTVDPRLFSSFVEQLGRAVYGGVYEPGHPLADSDGFRTDVMDLVKALSVPLVRFPGGNYVSNHTWEDSVGPVDERPVRLDLAWSTLDPNLFGIKEFISWTKKVGTEPMMAVNLGTRGIEAARNLVEYCNFPKGSTLSDLRRSHGSQDPYDIKMWCLGNEMDGPWQVGHKSAGEYGSLAAEVGKALKLFDPTLELVVCGSSNAEMPTFPQWEETVLEQSYEVVDYLSLHCYYRNDENDFLTFLASSVGMDAFIEGVVHVCDCVKAKKRSKKTIYLSFDEWNVWFHSKGKDRQQPKWIIGPQLLEDIYTFEDALVVGTLLNSLMRHCDRVKVACLAQLVNTIAPIMTETGGPAWRQTIYWPFYYASKYGRGEILDLRFSSNSYECKQYGTVPYADPLMVYHPENGELDLFLVNRSPLETLTVNLDLSGFGEHVEVLEHIVLNHDNLKAVNDKEHPDEVYPQVLEGESLFSTDGNLWKGKVLPASWNLFRFTTTCLNRE